MREREREGRRGKGGEEGRKKSGIEHCVVSRRMTNRRTICK
jgi:hypothetical protein